MYLRPGLFRCGAFCLKRNPFPFETARGIASYDISLFHEELFSSHEVRSKDNPTVRAVVKPPVLSPPRRDDGTALVD